MRPLEITLGCGAAFDLAPAIAGAGGALCRGSARERLVERGELAREVEQATEGIDRRTLIARELLDRDEEDRRSTLRLRVTPEAPR
jgi:hypothetical protein